MITLCQDENLVEQALEYIGEDYPKVPYCYINLKKYGLTNESVKVWLDMEAGRICGIYLLYYDCLHFVTFGGDYPYNRIAEMVEKLMPRVVMVQGEVGERLEASLSDTFETEKNYVIDLGLSVKGNLCDKVTLAQRNDMSDIAHLMINDEEYVHVYEGRILQQQLVERYEDGFGRYFVIRDGKKICATFCTYGEIKNFALLGGLLVHPAYRRQGLGSLISKHAYEVLHQENISAVGFVNYLNKPSLDLHQKLGARPIASLFKFVRKQG